MTEEGFADAVDAVDVFSKLVFAQILVLRQQIDVLRRKALKRINLSLTKTLSGVFAEHP